LPFQKFVAVHKGIKKRPTTKLNTKKSSRRGLKKRDFGTLREVKNFFLL